MDDSELKWRLSFFFFFFLITNVFSGVWQGAEFSCATRQLDVGILGRNAHGLAKTGLLDATAKLRLPKLWSSSVRAFAWCQFNPTPLLPLGNRGFRKLCRVMVCVCEACFVRFF